MGYSVQNLNELLEKISLELKYDEIVILTSLLEEHDKASNIHSYSMTDSIRYDSEKYNFDSNPKIGM